MASTRFYIFKTRGNMNNSSKCIVLTLFLQIDKWRVNAIVPKFQWSKLHLSIVRDYFVYHSKTCDFWKLAWAKLLNRSFQYTGPASWRIRTKIAASFTQELKVFFMVPRLKNLLENQSRIKKYQLVEVFLSFLLQLLYHKTYSIIHLFKDGIENLEKELRFLLTVVADTSLMVCVDENEASQELLAEIEAVANEAGSLIHSLFFSTHRGFRKINRKFAVVLNHIELTKSDIMKFLDLLSSISISAYTFLSKTSVMDSLLIIDSLIYDVEDMMKREDNRIADAKDQIKTFHHVLIPLQSSIKDIKTPQPSEIGELKEPLMQIGDMVHEAEYLIISFLVRDAPLWYFIHRLTHVNRKIELIGTELQQITSKYIGDPNVAKQFRTQSLLQDKRNTELNDITVGSKDKETHILDYLTGGTESIQVISIIGMPGLGKTTLAKKLYHHPWTNHWFDIRSLCIISQTYQRPSILTDILIDVNSELEKDRILQMDEESLVLHIFQTLKGRRYLIVMDDVWDPNVWYDLRRCFPDDGNGSRVLLTTRDSDVAPPGSILYALPSLSDDQCWELLEKKVFGNNPSPAELQEIGKKIAANCCGLPLTVVVMAGILSNKDKDKSAWEEVGRNLASYIFDGGDNSVMQILDLSYKHLPDHLKPCFLYFGEFKGGVEIPVGQLLRLWISEGFIPKEGEKSAENVAEEYLTDLVNKSLVMVAKRRRLDGGVKTCVIHDLLLDLCFRRCEEENFLKYLKRENYSIYKKEHRVCVVDPDYGIIGWSCCQHIRSFHCYCPPSSTFYIRDMRLLRVLHFDFVLMYHRLIGTEYLVNLRYLVIDADLLESLGSLVNLEYLCVKLSYGVVQIPPVIVRMRKLRYLEASPGGAINDQDCNISQTNKLEFISCILIRDIKDEEILKCSPHLRKLKCTYKRPSIENTTYNYFDLCFLTQLESLHLSALGFGTLEIRFPSNIKKLSLSGMTLTWDKMSIIGKLEKLEVLKLGLGAFVGVRWDTRDDEFQKLRYFKLDVSYLSEWNVGSSQHFPQLQQLALINCWKLQEIPYEIGEITTLELIELKGRYSESLVESAKRIQQERRDMTNEELRLIFTYRWGLTS